MIKWPWSKKPTYAWVAAPDAVVCYPSAFNTQLVGRLRVASPSPFHDKQLVAATAEINKILAEAAKTNPAKDLAFLETPRGFFLAWCGEADSNDSEEKTILDFLKIQPPEGK